MSNLSSYTNTQNELQLLEETMRARNEPRQKRSKARLSELLDVAESIIIETGMDGLRMREVSRQANMPIASIYHYYPSVTALFRALVLRLMDQLSTLLRAKFAVLVTDKNIELIDLISVLIDDFVEFVFTHPSTTAIFGGIRANPQLRMLDIQDTFNNAEFLQPVIKQMQPHLSDTEAKLLALVIVDATVSNVLLAAESPPEMRADIIKIMKSYILSTLQSA